ncbi:hypothetical protein [Streptomyces sp. BK340]|uniref:hypothetical protein n=1 Tax=Streptomyces sp. BK340 TaxID=2572903 RepID=UPI0011A82595|nr:hypothetical protein [Streptomyces sp. BK340]TVZ99430.1 hypothetical protein FB157_101447 [Streptomyces sp. BK340]
MNTERPENSEEPEVSAVSDATESAEEPGAPDVSKDSLAPKEALTAKEPLTAETSDAPESSDAPEASGVSAVPGSGEGAGTPHDEVGEGDEAPEIGEVLEAGDAGTGERSGRRRSPMVVVSVAAAVLLVGGGGAILSANHSSDGRTGAGGSGGGGTPPPLVLDGWTQGGTGGIAPGEPDPYGATYVAAGKLAEGPGSAPVYAPKGEVGKDDVARLAKALGVDGTPVAEGPGWRVGGKDGSGPTLRVTRDAPGSWTFSRYAPGTDNCKKITVCVQDPGAPAGEPVSVAVAEKAAAPVLKALGQDDAKVDAGQIMGAQRVVNADPVVGGLPTYGWTTGLTVDKQGDVVGGHGLLVAPAEGNTYPVLGAEKTLALMNSGHEHGHRMGIGGCASPVPLKNRLEQPCGTSTTASGAAAVTVEKAVFGLAAHSVAGRQTLVPSWLFEVRGSAARGTFTVAYPAVDPKYLTSPSDAAPSPEPSSPSSAPKTHDVKVGGYTAEGRALKVSFSGGVCADYKAAAKESADRVTVTVTEKVWPDNVCVAMARMYVRTVRLDAPLDGRKVVGPDGAQIPRAKSGVVLPQAR